MYAFNQRIKPLLFHEQHKEPISHWSHAVRGAFVVVVVVSSLL